VALELGVVLAVGVGAAVGPAVPVAVAVGPAVPVAVAVGPAVPVFGDVELPLSHPTEAKLRIPTSIPSAIHVLFVALGARPDSLRAITFVVPTTI